VSELRKIAEFVLQASYEVDHTPKQTDEWFYKVRGKNHWHDGKFSEEFKYPG